jgi:hypothetical protein
VAMAKKIARTNHISVSAMFSNFILSMTPVRRVRRTGPLTRKAREG